MAEVTRRMLLEDFLRRTQNALKMAEKLKGDKWIDQDRLEEDIREQEERCRLIREMIQDYENPDVRAACAKWRNEGREPADWQLELMAGKEPDLKL